MFGHRLRSSGLKIVEIDLENFGLRFKFSKPLDTIFNKTLDFDIRLKSFGHRFKTLDLEKNFGRRFKNIGHGKNLEMFGHRFRRFVVKNSGHRLRKLWTSI